MYTELHFHTSETSFCGKVSAVNAVPRYKDHGYDAIIVTDHFARNYFEPFYSGKQSWKENVDTWLKGYRAAKEAGDKHGIKVFLGCELSFDHFVENDYLVYGLTEDMLYQYPELWKMTEQEFKVFADEHRLFFAQAHPYRGWCKPCDPAYLHGTEMFNGHNHHESHNDLALKRWLDTGLIPLCGTDFHDPDTNLGCGVRFKKDAESIQDIVSMLFAGEYDIVIPQNYRFMGED